MNHVLLFLPQVETDVLRACAWYKEKALGLGEEFLRSVYAACEELARNPQVYAQVHRDFRRRLLRRFPCAIYYRLNEDRVIVFGLFHCARDPRGLRKKLGDRRQGS